jgi:tryptophan halogenase
MYTKNITIVGSGTAGLLAGLMIKAAYPRFNISILSSSKIGIVGVGEGSTEHWRMFMDICKIPLAEMLNETHATHKNGIRFENWTKHTPDYFHSVASVPYEGLFQISGLYNGLVEAGKTLTENTASRAMIENKVRADNPHTSVNQYHFDTNRLNDYLQKLCQNRGISIEDTEVIKVNLNNENGYIESVMTSNMDVKTSDFWIDASGTARVLMNAMGNTKWRSYSKFLQMNAAIAFPTESDPSGQIRPYTRARATANGWVWEIPTQSRRGNGYVFNSDLISDDQAIKDVSDLLGFEVTPKKSFKFEPGSLDKMWYKNCLALGLCSSFVEPLEATSISSTIQQIRCFIENFVGYDDSNSIVGNNFNKKMDVMMDNLVSMISLHYISDRDDSEMWRNQKNMEKPEYLNNLLDLWSVRSPMATDVGNVDFELFHVPHLYHVAQGQGVLKRENATRLIEYFNIRDHVIHLVDSAKIEQSNHAKVDHAESLKQIQI